MATKKKVKMIIVSIDDYVFLETIARRERLANGGTLDPKWCDIGRRFIAKGRKDAKGP